MSKELAERVLAVPMDPSENDAEASSIKDYLIGLLDAVWYEGEGFSGKRPFGNSGWEFELYKALGDAGMIEISYYYDEEDGYRELEDVDEKEGRRLITLAIQSLY